MNDRETLRTDLNVFADFNPRLPERYRSQPYLLLGNIQPALQRGVRAQMNGLRLVGGDTMNYWIAYHRAKLLETIAEWDCRSTTAKHACSPGPTICAAPRSGCRV